MDDCNGYLVRNTISILCSDSSMDDCNKHVNTNIIYSKGGSDSSMDDCNNLPGLGLVDPVMFRFLYGRL